MSTTSGFVQNVPRSVNKMSCLFCEFVNGNTDRHANGYPFRPVYETKNTLAFLSIDFPATEDGHVLIIPKPHAQYLNQLPVAVQHELIETVSLATTALQKTHDACNVLLNNGEAAGQYIHHVHFHIVPRDPNDNIAIEVWEPKTVSTEQFNQLCFSLQEAFASAEDRATSHTQ